MGFPVCNQRLGVIQGLGWQGQGRIVDRELCRIDSYQASQIERIHVEFDGCTVELDGFSDGRKRQRQPPHLMGITNHQHIGADPVAKHLLRDPVGLDGTEFQHRAIHLGNQRIIINPVVTVALKCCGWRRVG